MTERLSREWFTAAELAELALPMVPHSARGVQLIAAREDWQRADAEGKHWRSREGRGGGIEYHYSVLPFAAQAKLALAFPAEAPARDERAATQAHLAAEDAWDWFDRLPDTKKAKARERLEALRAVEALVLSGTKKVPAMMTVAALRGVQLTTLYAWAELVRGRESSDWLPALAPRHAGGAGRAKDCSEDAWNALKADWLRPEKPDFASCHRRLVRLAQEHGWTLPSARTLQRRLEAIPHSIKVRLREGPDALKRLYPHQQRDRSGFHALQAVNTDGHTFDVFVRWPDGSVGRPTAIVFQDLYSSKILSWRIARSENSDDWRLALGDLLENWGVPDRVWLDNTRAAANKQMTGGVGTRFRFKVKADDPIGLFPLLNIEVHWTQPYSGQSKPIERAFRDFARDLAKDPRFAGAYTGNSPTAKPANYGSAAVPLDRFCAVLAEGISEHNARPGRRAATCAGRSFDETFLASYREHAALIRRATTAQRRMWLLKSEAVRVRTDGSVHFAGNRYWSDRLLDLIGVTVTLRFDPDTLHEPIHVHRMDGGYVCDADCVEPTGFADVEAARRHAAARRAWFRLQRELAAIENPMALSALADMQDRLEAPVPPQRLESVVVRPVFPTQGATAIKPEAPADPVADSEALLLRGLRQQGGPLRLVEEDDGGS